MDPADRENQPKPAAFCPLCGSPLDSNLLAILPGLEDHIARILSENNQGWKLDDGVCPDCVHDAVEKAIEARSVTSLQAELLTPFPVYSIDEKQLLTTPIRVHANPNFAGRGITVAFLDSGFYPHPDLAKPKDRILCYVDATERVPRRKTKLQVAGRHKLAWTHDFIDLCREWFYVEWTLSWYC